MHSRTKYVLKLRLLDYKPNTMIFFKTMILFNKWAKQNFVNVEKKFINYFLIFQISTSIKMVG